MDSLTILHPLEDLISSLLPNGQHNIWPALLLFTDARQFSHFFALSRAEEWMVSLTHLHSHLRILISSLLSYGLKVNHQSNFYIYSNNISNEWMIILHDFLQISIDFSISSMVLFDVIEFPLNSF